MPDPLSTILYVHYFNIWLRILVDVEAGLHVNFAISPFHLEKLLFFIRHLTSLRFESVGSLLDYPRTCLNTQSVLKVS